MKAKAPPTPPTVRQLRDDVKEMLERTDRLCLEHIALCNALPELANVEKETRRCRRWLRLCLERYELLGDDAGAVMAAFLAGEAFSTVNLETRKLQPRRAGMTPRKDRQERLTQIQRLLFAKGLDVPQRQLAARLAQRFRVTPKQIRADLKQINKSRKFPNEP